ncbi:MAG: TlpA family protein disulfide reductase [Clostridium sp.]
MIKIIGIILMIILIFFIGFIVISLVVFNRDVNKRMKSRKPIESIKIKSRTVNGENIDSSIFLKNKITMINIWGTYCSACIKELKDLQEIHDEFKNRDVGILGIIFDVTNENPKNKDWEKALKILNENKIIYPNILLDNDLKEDIKDKVFLIPTTIFVDRNGTVVREIIEAANSKSEYVEIIEAILNGNKENKNKKTIGEKCNINGSCNKE